MLVSPRLSSTLSSHFRPNRCESASRRFCLWPPYILVFFPCSLSTLHCHQFYFLSLLSFSIVSVFAFFLFCLQSVSYLFPLSSLILTLFLFGHVFLLALASFTWPFFSLLTWPVLSSHWVHSRKFVCFLCFQSQYLLYLMALSLKVAQMYESANSVLADVEAHPDQVSPYVFLASIMTPPSHSIFRIAFLSFLS